MSYIPIQLEQQVLHKAETQNIERYISERTGHFFSPSKYYKLKDNILTSF